MASCTIVAGANVVASLSPSKDFSPLSDLGAFVALSPLLDLDSNPLLNSRETISFLLSPKLDTFSLLSDEEGVGEYGGNLYTFLIWGLAWVTRDERSYNRI